MNSPKWTQYYDLKQGVNGYWLLIDKGTNREQVAGPKGYVLRTAEVLADLRERESK